MTTWIILRAAGIGSYLMLFLSVAWGLVATTSLVTKRVSKPTSTLFHQLVATVAFLLLGVHLAMLLLDRFMPFSPLDLLVPMRASYRPVAIAFGIVGMYATVVVLASSWVRKRLRNSLWRTLHLLAIPAFTMSLVHGVFAGTDTAQPWMWPIYGVTGVVTLFLVIVRGLTHGYRRPRAPRPDHAPSRTADDEPATKSSEPGSARTATRARA